MLSTAGAKVAKSDNDKMKRKLEDVFKQLQALEKEKGLSSRIRFVLRDIMVRMGKEGAMKAWTNEGIGSFILGFAVCLYHARKSRRGSRYSCT